MSEHVMRSIVDRHVGEAALLQRQGQNLYGQGNLDGAVRAFTEVNIPVFCHSISCVAAFRAARQVVVTFLTLIPQALKCPDVDALSVLDNRAATYTKLLRYEQALKDARQMIKQDKQDERVRKRPSQYFHSSLIGLRDIYAVPKHYCWMGSPRRLVRCMRTH